MAKGSRLTPCDAGSVSRLFVTPALLSRLSRFATLRYRYATLRYATLRFAMLLYATLRYATLRFASLRFFWLHCVTLIII